jgi:hypothetical protein
MHVQVRGLITSHNMVKLQIMARSRGDPAPVWGAVMPQLLPLHPSVPLSTSTSQARINRGATRLSPPRVRHACVHQAHGPHKVLGHMHGGPNSKCKAHRAWARRPRRRGWKRGAMRRRGVACTDGRTLLYQGYHIIQLPSFRLAKILF